MALETNPARTLFLWMDDLGRLLDRLHVSPSAVTITGLGVTSAGAVLIGSGYLLSGALIVGAGSALDALDGPLARATGKASERGAVLDSLSDRFGETFMWSGLAYYVAGQPLLVVLCLLSLGFSYGVSYLRSKAEALGIDGTGGWMARPFRVLLYVVGTGSGLVEPMLWLMVPLTGLTVLQRLGRIWSDLAK
jgi:CDP-diacylglycerol--glycerol-3-phosphate 3-phosphatidyltransferase